ncbi:unnamed protein product [Cylindrotheca closterium]|uniref:DUF6824 domain-containing protein n=1 Tax=Cylindrotheca closterium TaxID=2856 RepID=A0AAD2JM98_9STRA|nr:unnamed protein product [Cylindrotheca closterium]
MTSLIGEHDVVIAKGRGGIENQGYKEYSDLITENWEEYHNSDKNDVKAVIVATIIKSIRDRGGKFLKPASKGKDEEKKYIELKGEDLEHAVQHRMRYQTKKKGKTSGEQGQSEVNQLKELCQTLMQQIQTMQQKIQKLEENSETSQRCLHILCTEYKEQHDLKKGNSTSN